MYCPEFGHMFQIKNPIVLSQIDFTMNSFNIIQKILFYAANTNLIVPKIQ